VHSEHRLYRVDTRCPQCGISMPKLPMCRLTGTCIQCARSMLSNDVCDKCPDRDLCSVELRGLNYFKEIEQKISIILPDFLEVFRDEIIELCKTSNKRINIEDIENFVRVVVTILNTLHIVKDISKWLVMVFKPEVIRWIIKAPLELINFSNKFRSALREYSLMLEVDYKIVENIVKLLTLRFISYSKNIKDFIYSTFKTEIAILLTQRL